MLYKVRFCFANMLAYFPLQLKPWAADASQVGIECSAADVGTLKNGYVRHTPLPPMHSHIKARCDEHLTDATAHRSARWRLCSYAQRSNTMKRNVGWVAVSVVGVLEVGCFQLTFVA